jgi:hypothetical protein
MLAAVIAGALLVTCVLPAEYGVDPTGIGRVLGLTQMGEVKLALAEEAASNAASEASADSVIAASEAVPGTAAPAAVAGTVSAATRGERTDTTEITLVAGKGGEVKLRMPSGSKAAYSWTVTGGVVNYDMHGDSTNAPKDWFVSYKKRQRVSSDVGELVAGFSGNHGWYWRNRGSAPVTVRLVTTGSYGGIDKHL